MSEQTVETKTFTIDLKAVIKSFHGQAFQVVDHVKSPTRLLTPQEVEAVNSVIEKLEFDRQKDVALFLQAYMKKEDVMKDLTVGDFLKDVVDFLSTANEKVKYHKVIRFTTKLLAADESEAKELVITEEQVKELISWIDLVPEQAYKLSVKSLAIARYIAPDLEIED